MRYAFLLLGISLHAATLVVDPPVIYDCTGTVGRAVVRWKDAAGPVQILVGPSRAVFTGFGGTSGSAETGTWVSEGLEFRLVNARGVVEAQTRARVECNSPTAAGNGMVGSSYFPLDVGNQWIYRVDSRVGTSDYVTWTVTGQRQAGDRVYAEITAQAGGLSSIAMLLREEAGILYRLSGLREEVYLNPGAASHAPFRNALGSYPDAASQTVQSVLTRESQVFVRGVGLARTRSDLLTGSSGGFTSSMELIEFRLATGPRVEGPVTPRIAVSIESAVLDVTGGLVTNCAIPCYFTACGFAGPVDPPGTYKPCARTRIEAAAEGNFPVDISVRTLDGAAVYQSTLLGSSGDAVRYVQVPLYSTGNRPFSPGTYVLSARTSFGAASMLVELR